MRKYTPLQRQIAAKRQALRIHIESMRATQESLRKRARSYKYDPMMYKTARQNVDRLGDKIAKAERELTVLETKWVF